MANNVPVLDATEVSTTFKTTDTAGVHVPHVNVDSNALPTGAATSANQSSMIALLPASLGAKAAAASLAVTGSTEDVARIGATNETAATDSTSTAGLNALLKALLREAMSTDPVAVTLPSQYETVAASATTQALGATGAVGDKIEHLICVVATAATSQVQIKDGTNTAITVLPNDVGAGVGTYTVPLGLVSVQGAWQVTTAAGVSVIAVGDFT